MVSRILEEAGFRVGSVSSFWYKIGAKEIANPLHMTMPGRFRLQKLLRQMLGADCQYAVLEVTSEGIKQHRHQGINFDIAVLTNLSLEHIEAHGSFEKYRQAKSKLFAGLAKSGRKHLGGKKISKVSVVNLDDENAEYFLQFKADKKYGFRIENREWGMENGEARSKKQGFNQGIMIIQATRLRCEERFSQFSIHNFPFSIPLLGIFNIYNTLAATAVGLSQGVGLKQAAAALVKIETVPGRLEFIQREPFSVIVDLAHTPSALENIYQTCQKMLKPGAKMIVVFGAAGGLRDHWKRPKLGELADKYCDIIILTNEDPYDEDPEKIIEDILSGISGQARNRALLRSSKNKVLKILDRRQAIKQALKLAQPSDIVLILGKGTEPNMVFSRGKKIPWDDRQVVREEFAKIQNRNLSLRPSLANK